MASIRAPSPAVALHPTAASASAPTTSPCAPPARGTTQCNSNAVAVTQAPALPTCSASISPGSGNTNTDFTIAWSSNGSSCTWALDGVNQGAVPCSGSAPSSRFGVGSHYVTLRTTGPGGSTQCNSNTVSVR
ncbi:MAG: hypothetical protein IPG96_06320 [Proteobacteria bacterium]|nr:hypothetical protein [Pseudomonadota bacterium]